MEIEDSNRKNWIILPKQFTRGEYNVHVDSARLAYSPAVEKVGKELGLNLNHTSTDSMGREFIDNMNWTQALRINQALGYQTLVLSEFVGLGKLLYSGSKGEVDVYDANHRRLSPKLCRNYFNDIFEVGSPKREEWIDERFTGINEDITRHSRHVFSENGDMTSCNSESLDSGIIDQEKCMTLEGWFESSSPQGFPLKDAESGEELVFLSPKNHMDTQRVAMFQNLHAVNRLYCSALPGFESGVRAARQIK
ncbi:MAG: hypothetical protein ABIA78_00840 [archaeon]